MTPLALSGRAPATSPVALATRGWRVTLYGRAPAFAPVGAGIAHGEAAVRDSSGRWLLRGDLGSSSGLRALPHRNVRETSAAPVTPPGYLATTAQTTSREETAMRGHGLHMWMCAAMVVGALVAVLVTVNGLYILPALGCVLMIGAMLWMMGGMVRHAGRSNRVDRD